MLTNLMLGVFDEFVLWITKPPVIVALVLCVIGVALAVLARRIARVIRKTNDIADNDRYYITFKVFAMIALFASALIIILM